VKIDERKSFVAVVVERRFSVIFTLASSLLMAVHQPAGEQ
jgi:hypothetical protein